VTTVVSETRTLADIDLVRLDAWWRAANYLTIGQIYLRGNPLLREPCGPSTRRSRDSF
jgi:xylulose-5-phosphate/fructose-6-phosphate phosphoketolase